MKSLDKQTTSLDEKSDTEAEKSLPTEESTQEKKWKRIRHLPADYHHKEKQQAKYHQKMSQKQGIVEEVFQAHESQETSQAATIQKQRQITETPKEFFKAPLSRPPIT